MPSKAKHPCAHGRCPNLAEYGQRYCEEHKPLHDEFMRLRGMSRPSYTLFYKSSKWRDMRRVYLKQHPFCVECQRQGITTKATVVDHIKPHKGDKSLFFDTNNWQPLCKKCHDNKTLSRDTNKKKKITWTYQNT